MLDIGSSRAVRPCSPALSGPDAWLLLALAGGRSRRRFGHFLLLDPVVEFLAGDHFQCELHERVVQTTQFGALGVELTGLRRRRHEAVIAAGDKVKLVKEVPD